MFTYTFDFDIGSKVKIRALENLIGSDHCYFGDLDKLKEEVKELNSEMQKRLAAKDYGLKSWNAFYVDVMSARKILKFH